MDKVVIIGAGLAGAKAAEHLARAGIHSVLVGKERFPPYDRPPLSKKFLRGETEENALLLRPAAWYADHGITLRLGTTARSLDAGRHELVLHTGEPLRFDGLILATGASPRTLSCPGADLEGVHVLRAIEDSATLQNFRREDARVVIVGAGVIGLEVAASFRLRGAHVTVLEYADTPLLRAVGASVGSLYAGFHRARGVDLRLGRSVTRIEGAGRVDAVITDDGERLPCDAVITGIGVAPDVSWLAGSGIHLDRGVLASEACATNLPSVYAAGDCARFWVPDLATYVGVESVDNAIATATTAATNLLGGDARIPSVPFFWSDQFDLRLQCVGHVGAFDEVLFRGSVEKPAFAAFHLYRGALRYCVAVNRMKEIGVAKKLIASKIAIPPAALADEAFDLSSLLPRP